MRPNVHLMGDEIIRLQRERRARLERAARETKQQMETSIELLAGLVTLGITLTACLLVLAL